MSWGDFGDDWLKNGLPVFDGGKDKTLARKAIDKLGGPGSFRTEITAMPDGTTVITQTKGTMPPQIRITGTVQPYVERTFVFNEAGSTTAMIANRAGATMRRVRYPYTVVPAASYKVGPVNTSGNAQHWNDVWRLDSVKFLANAKAAKTGPTTVAYAVAGGAGAPVPWLTSYAPPTRGDSDRTALFIGATEGDDYGGNPFGVSGATFDGTPIDLTTPPTLGDTYFQANALGVRVDAAGNFHFYWMGTAVTFVTHHAVITPSNGGAPILAANTAENSGLANGLTITIVASGSNPAPVYGVKESCTFDAHYSWLDDGADRHFHYGTEYVDKTAKGYYGTRLKTIPSQISHHDSLSFYSDSPFPATLSIDITGSEQWKDFESGVEQAIRATFPPYSVWVVGSEGVWAEWERSSETTVSFLAEGLAPIYLAHSTVNSTAYSRNTHTETITYTTPPPLVHTKIALYMGDDKSAEQFAAILAQKDIIGRDSYGNHHSPIDSSSQQIVVSNVDNSANRTDTITLHLESNDYLFLDVDEGISLRLNAVYDYEKTHVDPGCGQPITLQPMYGNPDVSRLTVKYILDVRGVIKEFVMYDGTFTEPDIPFVNTEGEWDSEPVFHGYHVPGTNIRPILTAIMEQGKCAWIAYTTKAEEAAGATPEFYIDALVLPSIYATTHRTARNNPWTFNPLMLNKLFTNYLGRYADTSETGFFYGTLYGTPMRIQYATGLSNPWPEKLGAPFTADSHVEISRI